MILKHANTLLQCVNHYATQQPEHVAYRFLPQGEGESITLSWAELEQRAHRLACDLVFADQQGRPVILMYPPGLEFIVALLACFKAGAIAVPSNVARGSHHIQRLSQILQDSGAHWILTTPALSHTLIAGVANEKITCHWENKLPHKEVTLPVINAEQLAFLQYTSGSTSIPKGVMVSHHNLIHNLRAMKETFGLPEGVIIGGWIPQFHDMGLVGHILLNMALGGQYIFMPPLSFIQKPQRWPQLMSDYGAQFSCAPNFAYDLSANSQPANSQLNLSRWRWAGNGAEPVRSETLLHFSHIFAEYGFTYQSLTPCYGMAEATLVISSATSSDSPFSLQICPIELENGKLVITPNGITLMSCGKVAAEHRIIIVNPETKVECQQNEIGEIWVQGPSIAVGYWNNNVLTEKDFLAHTTTGEGPFLRTGDLGCLYQHHLFVTGRLKDLMIIRGRNLYPQDIEFAAIAASEVFRPGKAIAFAQAERIVLAIELKRGSAAKIELKKLEQQLRQSLTEKFDIDIEALLFIQTNQLPMTTSGKVQRQYCRSLYLQGALKTIPTTAEITRTI